MKTYKVKTTNRFNGSIGFHKNSVFGSIKLTEFLELKKGGFVVIEFTDENLKKFKQHLESYEEIKPSLKTDKTKPNKGSD